MRLLKAIISCALVAGCSGSDAPPKSVAKSPALYRTVIEAEGIPFEVLWDRNDRTRAMARVFGIVENVAIDPSNVVSQATGCMVTERPEQVPSLDGVVTFMVETACSPAEIRSETEAALSRELAREIGVALTLVSTGSGGVSDLSIPEPASAEPSLYEGSPFAAFNAGDIQRYCGESWESRIAEDGRTQYNPCKRREMFR